VSTLFDDIRALPLDDQNAVVEALITSLPSMQLEANAALEGFARQLAEHHARTRMPPVLRCAWCEGRTGVLPVPATRLTPFDLIALGSTTLVAGRHGVFLCADCIRSAWAALSPNPEGP
jgi:hypothetical protein